MLRYLRIKRPRFSVQMLLICVTAAALSIVCWNSYYAWYKQNYGYEVIDRVLRNKIRNGDSIEAVSARLIFEGENKRFLETHPNADWIRRNYASRPSGLRDSDQLMEFSLGNSYVFLQFREGKLINHDPADFLTTGNVLDLEKLKKTPIAKKLEEVRREMGMPQAIAGCIAVVTLSLAVGLAKRRSYSPMSLRWMLTIPATLCATIICLASNLQPAMLGVIVVGLTAAVAWNIAGRSTSRP